MLGLVAAGYYFGGRQPLAHEVASNFWVRTHLTCLAYGFVSVLVGFVVGIMDLVQASRLKHKIPPQQGLKLPSLESLERTGRSQRLRIVRIADARVADRRDLEHG